MGASMHKRSLALSLLISLAPSTFAASSVDLSVQGAITPSACTPSLSEGGVVDYGKIAARDLNYSTITYLQKFNMDFAVNCDAPALFAIRGEDNRPQNFSAGGFGFARASNDEPVGAFYLFISNYLADGVPVTAMSSSDGQFWTPLVFFAFEPDVLTGFGHGNAPIPTTDLSVSLSIEGVVYQTSWLPIHEGIPIDGSATLEVRYL
ncbi:DUF1120 domain-containing protein [Pseudomonas cedrina]|uniref:DUF1120 domain-containing protein n=1 Tax=Pseudomonas cedrina TaxID=651740 RepID=UPI0027818D06|nr:DUF1120 domain-containing protein [Pseudomonas cedrina]MDQ0650572.1 hypothetical protein [Pseudomonas cedrina]